MTNQVVKRESFPDTLRGLALLGIAVVNVPFLTISTIEGAGGADLTSTPDAIVAFIVATFAQAKFYLIFSFLFGYSAQFILKGERSNRRRWVMRSIGLVIFGFAHSVLLFHGDILLTYGLLALVLLAFYFRSDRTIAVWMWVLYGASTLLMSGLTVITVIGEQLLDPADLAELSATPTSLDVALASGGLLESIAARFDLLSLVTPQVLFIQGQLVIVGFLAGVLAARRRVFDRTTENRARMKTVALWGALIGLPLQALAAWIFIVNTVASDSDYSYGFGLVSFALNAYGAPPLSAAIVAGLWLVTERASSQDSLLSSAGQMSLTMYLGQSLITTVLFSNWGLGLFGTMGLLDTTLMAIGIWCALALVATLILKRQSSGPMERVLKRFSLIGTSN